jgi:hypothetical protein
MILPTRFTHRPRITLGQILASVAVSTMPIALIARGMQGQQSTGAVVVASLFCVVLTFMAEVFFWGFFVPLVPSLQRALGRPSWFNWELVIDPSGIKWVDDRSREEDADAGPDEIRFLD